MPRTVRQLRKSGAEGAALQMRAQVSGTREPREASGVRRLQRRFCPQFQGEREKRTGCGVGAGNFTKVQISRLLNRIWTAHLLVWGLSLATPAAAQSNATVAPPRVFLLDGNRLVATREKIRAGDPSLAPALERLKRQADDALKAGPFSVTFKNQTPPSGDKHDYLSQAPYFWPNPNTSNGLPYIRHDGRRNPEINRISDHRSIGDLSDAVETLALAFYFTGHEAYADKAAKLIRTWFLDLPTRMNPNLEFAQGVPGVTTGRGFGLIESRGLSRVTDAVGLLAGSPSWTSNDQRGLEEWFGRFLQWMRESKNGREESDAKNNHGTYYDIQAVSFELFLGHTDRAREILETAKTKRLARQIEPDGGQPLELARTNAWGYSTGNLTGLMTLADIGERVGVDLWHYQTPDGGSLRKAIEYLAPFVFGDRKWLRPTSTPSRQSLASLVRRAAPHYRDPEFQALVAKAGRVSPDSRENLLRLTPAGSTSIEE